MKTYTVWFRNDSDNDCIFISGVPGEALAVRIAEALQDEGFVYRDSWVEEE